MTIVISEKFDGVAAPALPSDVTAVTANSATITTSTNFALSGANSVVAGNVTNPNATIYSNIADSTSGNCTVTCSVYFATVNTGSYAGPVIGVGGKWPRSSAASNNSYVMEATPDVGLNLARFAAGVQTNIGPGLGSTSTFAAGIWYTLTLTRNGSQIFGSCQRQSDLMWLNTSDVWQANYVLKFNLTDASPLAASASYGGISMDSTANNAIYGDNFSVRDLKTTMPAGPIKGMCIQSAWYPNNLNNNGQVWGTNFYLTGQGGLQTQVNLAKSIGCNCIRMSSGLDAIYTGQITMPTYLSRLGQMISYCKSLGMWWYHDEDEQTQYFAAGGGQQASLFNAHIADLVSVAQVLASYPNVLGLDVMNEFSHINQFNMYNGTATLAGTFAMTPALWEVFFQQAIASIRAVAPSLPLTASYPWPVNAAGWTISGSPSSMYQFDFVDRHTNVLTYSPAVGDSQNHYLSIGAQGKPMWLGETSGANTSNRSAGLTATWSNAVLASYAGQPGCIGMEWYVVVPDIVSPGDTGAWDGSNPAVPRADVVTTMNGFASLSYSFGSNLRRRRR